MSAGPETVRRARVAQMAVVVVSSSRLRGLHVDASAFGTRAFRDDLRSWAAVERAIRECLDELAAGAGILPELVAARVVRGLRRSSEKRRPAREGARAVGAMRGGPRERP